MRYEISLIADDGSPLSVHAIEAEDDDAAIDHAGSLTHPFAIEVRDGQRLVARIPPWGGGLFG